MCKLITLIYFLVFCKMLCKTYTSLLTIAILSTIGHITMCYCNVNTISNMLHLLSPPPPPPYPVMQCFTEY